MRVFFICFLLAFFSAATRSQVTIGSILKPRDGLLLELKENEEEGLSTANATKGLGLPRVSLESTSLLTIDNQSEEENYVGVVVYNTTTNASLTPGTYVWNGKEWRLLIPVLGKGEDGQVLTSLGNGKAKWDNYFNYDFFKPSFIIEENLSASQTYSFSDITYVPHDINPTTNKTRYPRVGLFSKDLYSTEFKTKTNNLKLINITLGVRINTKTMSNAYIYNPVWINLFHQVSIDNTTINANKGGFSTAIYEMTFDPTIEYKVNFSILLAPEETPKLSIGTHNISFKVGIAEKSYDSSTGRYSGGSTVYANGYNTNSGSFYESEGSFLKTEITSLTMVLYEK